MPDHRIHRIAAVGVAAIGLVALTACGDSSESAAPSSSAPITSSSTSQSSSSRAPSTSATSARTSEPRSTTTPAPDYPSQGTTEHIEEPKSDKRSKFLAELKRKNVDVSDDLALSLGTSLCSIKKSNGQKDAEAYAKPVLEAESGKTPSSAQVRDFVDAVDILC